VSSSVRPFGIRIRTGNLLLFLVKSGSASIDLSKARKLNDVAFLRGRSSAQWVVTALQTITPKHRNLQQITLYAPYAPYNPTLNRADPTNVRYAFGETIYRQWLELDHLLAQLWESHSIRLKVLYHECPEVTSSCVDTLLPEVTRRGIVDLVKGRW
jgi:hypothetical protein